MNRFHLCILLVCLLATSPFCPAQNYFGSFYPSTFAHDGRFHGTFPHPSPDLNGLPVKSLRMTRIFKDRQHNEDSSISWLRFNVAGQVVRYEFDERDRMDGHAWKQDFSYDARGRLISSVGRKIAGKKDYVQRLDSSTYIYDREGRLASVTTFHTLWGTARSGMEVTEEVIVYDYKSLEDRCIKSNCYRLKGPDSLLECLRDLWFLDSAGHPTAMVYLADTTDPASVQNNRWYLDKQINWTRGGLMSDFENGREGFSYQYDPDGRLLSIRWSDRRSCDLRTWTRYYEYDERGLLTAIRHEGLGRYQSDWQMRYSYDLY